MSEHQKIQSDLSSRFFTRTKIPTTLLLLFCVWHLSYTSSYSFESAQLPIKGSPCVSIRVEKGSVPKEVGGCLSALVALSTACIAIIGIANDKPEIFYPASATAGIWATLSGLFYYRASKTYHWYITTDGTQKEFPETFGKELIHFLNPMLKNEIIDKSGTIARQDSLVFKDSILVNEGGSLKVIYEPRLELDLVGFLNQIENKGVSIEDYLTVFGYTGSPIKEERNSYEGPVSILRETSELNLSDDLIVQTFKVYLASLKGSPNKGIPVVQMISHTDRSLQADETLVVPYAEIVDFLFDGEAYQVYIVKRRDLEVASDLIPPDVTEKYLRDQADILNTIAYRENNDLLKNSHWHLRWDFLQPKLSTHSGKPDDSLSTRPVPQGAFYSKDNRVKASNQ